MKKIGLSLKLWFWFNVLCFVIFCETVWAVVRRKELSGPGTEAIKTLLGDTLERYL